MAEDECREGTGSDERVPYAQLLDALPQEALYFVDSDGVIRSWNRGAEQLLGYRREDVIGQPFAVLFPPEQAKDGRPQRLLSAARTAEHHAEECWWRRQDGARRWASVMITPVDASGSAGDGFAVVMRELRDPSRSPDELRRSEERMRHFVEVVQDYAILMLDTEGYIRSWNAGVQRLEGYTRDEIIGRHFSVFYPEADKAALKPERELEIAKATGRYEEEGWRIRKDGTRFWANVVITAVFDDRHALVGFTKVTRDFSERRVSEETLRQSEERFRLMVESVRDYAIFMLDPDGKIASWNLGAERIKGYRADEIIGKHFSMFYSDADRAREHPQEELREAIQHGSFSEEGWRIRKDGTKFWASVVITAVYDNHHTLRGFAKVTRDLTERRRMAEDALDAERKMLEERSRMLEVQAALKQRDEFISVAAHELRTPLTALQLKLQSAAAVVKKSLVTQVSEQAGRLEDRLVGATRQTERLSELVEQLLDVSSIVAGKLVLHPEDFDLVTLCRAVVDDFQEPALHAGCQLFLHAGEPVAGCWDSTRMEQVLVNLLANAIKYGRGKPVEVTVGATDAGARISVADQGIGIAAEDMNRIFSRFERAASARHYGGLGLGLYVARSIVEAHGGSISVSSRAGHGATFVIDLPRRAGVALPSGQEAVG